MPSSPLRALASVALALLPDVVWAEHEPARRPPEARLSIPLASDSPLLQQEVEYGVQALLLGDLLAAQRDFQKVLELDEAHPLALCGLILCTVDEAARTRYAQALAELDDAYTPTPQEGRYMEGLYLLISQQEERAKEHFLTLSKQYRADLISRLWAALLMQDGYDELGQPRDAQTEAQELLYAPLRDENIQDHGLLYYLLAYVEADAPQPNEMALAYAREAMKRLPGEPMVQLVLAHHLVRAMERDGADVAKLRAEALELLEEAEAYYARAYLDEKYSQLDRDELISFFWLRIRIYRITLMLQVTPKEALALFREVGRLMPRTLDARESSSAVPLARSQPSGTDLLLWEWSLIPLRQMVASKRELSEAGINTLMKHARTYPLQLDHEIYRQVLALIELTLKARLSQQKGQHSLASERLQEAQELYAKLRQSIALDEASRKNPLVIRALASCDMALGYAQLAIYEDTAIIWETRLGEMDRRSNLLLPPLR